LGNQTERKILKVQNNMNQLQMVVAQNNVEIVASARELTHSEFMQNKKFKFAV
jgi:hypothetical protein